MDDARRLTELERELLELSSMGGETTTALDEEMLEQSPGRAVVDATLRCLVDRGLMTTSRGWYTGLQFSRDLQSASPRAYEDDWWESTPAGKEAVGLPPTPPLSD